jgi:hypothetical protein
MKIVKSGVSVIILGFSHNWIQDYLFFIQNFTQQTLQIKIIITKKLLLLSPFGEALE